ncbi:MAG: hypothetical protein ABH825_02460, partial [Candidatus Omnitrophota bacterium]
PPYLVGLARLLEMLDVALGVLLFLAFFAGTSFFMLPLAALGPLGKIERLRSVGMIAALLSGVWFFIIAVLRLIG